MATKLKPTGLDELFQQPLLEASEPARPRAASTVALVPRRGKEAVLDTDDVQIIVYEPFENRP